MGLVGMGNYQKKQKGIWIPEFVLGKVSVRAAILYGVLRRYAGRKAICWPSVTRLAKDTNTSRRTTTRFLNELIEARLVGKEFNVGISTKYVFNLPTHDTSDSGDTGDTGDKKGRPPMTKMVATHDKTDRKPMTKLSGVEPGKPNKTIKLEDNKNAKSPTEEYKEEYKGRTTPLKPPQGGKRKKSPVPVQFDLTASHWSWLKRRHGPVDPRQIRTATEDFMEHARAKGLLYVDWDAAWRTWMNNKFTDFGKVLPWCERNQTQLRIVGGVDSLPEQEPPYPVTKV